MKRLLLLFSLFASLAQASLPPGHHFRFERNYRDSATPRNDLIPFGSPTFSTDPLGVVLGSRALFLNGQTSTRLLLQSPIVFGSTQPWAVSWWARRASLGTSKGMVIGRPGTPGDFIWLNDSQRGLRFRNSSGTSFDFYAPKDSGMRHYVLVADGGGRLSLYLDGEPSETLEGDTSFRMDAVGEAFPTSASNFNFHGWIDELRVFYGALDAAQVRALHAEAATSPAPSPERVMVFLLGGQSNAVGHGPTSELPPEAFFPQEDVDFFYHFPGGPFVMATLRPGVSRIGSFGPEITMGRRLADLLGDGGKTRVALIKYANGGTNLHTQWKADGTASESGDGPEYKAFQETVRRGLAAFAAKYPAAEIVIGGMVWMQGESDRDPRFNPLYENNLRRFVSDVRATYDERMPFVIGRLSLNQTGIPRDQLDAIRAAQDRVAEGDGLAEIVDTDSMTVLPDQIHFDAAGLRAMGRAFGEKLDYLRWVNVRFNRESLDSGAGQPEAHNPRRGRTNREEYLFDWPEVFQNADMWSRAEGLLIRDVRDSAIDLEYLVSPRRFFSIEHYEHATNRWLAFDPPARGTGRVEMRSVAQAGRLGLFRLRIALPESPF